MTVRGGVRSLSARLARLEEKVVEPQGPVVYRVMFADGTPVWPGQNDWVSGAGDDIVYRIASWEELSVTDPRAGTGRRGAHS